MSNRTKAENAAANAGIPRMGFSVAEFCASVGISEGLYRKLRSVGQAPRETRVMRRVVITVEACTAWRQARESAGKVA